MIDFDNAACKKVSHAGMRSCLANATGGHRIGPEEVTPEHKLRMCQPCWVAWAKLLSENEVPVDLDMSAAHEAFEFWNDHE